MGLHHSHGQRHRAWPPRFAVPRGLAGGTGAPAVMPTATPPPHEMSEPTGPAGGDLEGAYPNPSLLASLKALLLGAGRVVTEYIANGAVTLEKLSAGVQATLAANAAAITWENVEALNANLSAAGAPFSATIRAGTQRGIVYLSGTVTVKVEVAAKGILFTLPPACRPESQRLVLFGDDSSAGSHNMIIKPNGEVEAVGALKIATSPIGLDGVTFALAG